MVGIRPRAGRTARLLAAGGAGRGRGRMRCFPSRRRGGAWIPSRAFGGGLSVVAGGRGSREWRCSSRDRGDICM